MNLAGYIRVSTEGQVDAFGKDVQREAILRWAGMNGHLITAFFEEDAVSGKTDSGDRPALRQLIDKAKRLPGHIEGLVALDATRLARRLIVQETLLTLVRDAGLRVFTTTADELGADEDPTRILVRQILGVIAEFDHRTTVNRLAAGRTAKSAQGGYIGGTTRYGTKVVGVGRAAQLVEDTDEMKIVEYILDRHVSGLSLRQIATDLNKRNIRTKLGNAWGPVQVSRIITRHDDDRLDSWLVQNGGKPLGGS